MLPRCIWMPCRIISLLIISIVVLSACKGSTGPPGLLADGTVTGKITVWEDAIFNSSNSPANVPAGGFTVSLVGDSTKSATTGPDGSYTIADVPAGVYVVETSREASSPIGYGTMRRYNFSVGGGTSNHSGSIGRKGPQPTSVSASIDSVAGTSGAMIPGIRVAWTINPPALQFSVFAYHLTFQSSTIGATVDVLGSGALSDTTIVVGLPPQTYTVVVQSDIGFGYVNESTGDTVFPTRSAGSLAPNLVTLTRPATIELTPKVIAREFPNQRVVGAKIIED